MASVANITITPTPLVPIFDSCIVTATGASVDVTITISCDGASYQDKRSPMGGVVSLEIAPYLRAFFAGASAYTRMKVVSVKVVHGAQTNDFTIYALFASSSSIFPLGEPITQRNYTAYPLQQFTLLADLKNQTFGVNGAGNYQLSTGYNDITIADYMTGGGYVRYKSFKYNFVADDCDCGQMFKWIDAQGFIRYFMFQGGEMTTTTKDKSDTMLKASQYTNEFGIFRNEYSTPVGYEMEVTKKYCATFTTEEDRRLLETMYTALHVWMVDKEENEKQVQIKRGKVSTAKGLQDFEIEIVLPSPKGLSL